MSKKYLFLQSLIFVLNLLLFPVVLFYARIAASDSLCFSVGTVLRYTGEIDLNDIFSSGRSAVITEGKNYLGQSAYKNSWRNLISYHSLFPLILFFIILILLSGAILFISCLSYKKAEAFRKNLIHCFENDCFENAAFPSGDGWKAVKSAALKAQCRREAFIENLNLEKKHLKDFAENIYHQVKTPVAAANVCTDLALEQIRKMRRCNDPGCMDVQSSVSGCTDAQNPVSGCLDVQAPVSGRREVPSAETERSFRDFLLKAEDQLVQSDRLLHKSNILLRTLLHLGQFESGVLHLKFEPYSLEEVLTAACEEVSGETGADIECSSCGEVQTVNLTGSPFWLEEAFLCLLRNAGDYAAPGGRISSEIIYRPGSAGVRVANNCAPEASLPDLTRYGTVAKDHFGIGLQLADAILTAHYGSLRFYRNGTYLTAEVSLPVLKGKDAYCSTEGTPAGQQ